MNANLLKSEIVKNGLTQKELCKAIGMSQSTFIRKVKKGIFNTDEIEKMIIVLKLDNPSQIFFKK